MTEPTANARNAMLPRLGLVVEDIADTRAWLCGILDRTFPGIEIAQAPTRRAAFDWIRSRSQSLGGADDGAGHHVALIDLGLPDGSGVEIIRELATRLPAVLPVVTTIYDDDAHLFDAIAAGAKGYLLKDQEADTLMRYLHRIDLGEPPLSPSIARRILDHFTRRAATSTVCEDTGETLTAREVDVLRLLGRGMRIGEAARVLGLTHHTVAGYVKVVYRKLNITSRAEAAVEAVRRGLV
jgi:DNA-binding NarL/FixJ family response regulator